MFEHVVYVESLLIGYPQPVRYPFRACWKENGLGKAGAVKMILVYVAIADGINGAPVAVSARFVQLAAMLLNKDIGTHLHDGFAIFVMKIVLLKPLQMRLDFKRVLELGEFYLELAHFQTSYDILHNTNIF